MAAGSRKNICSQERTAHLNEKEQIRTGSVCRRKDMTHSLNDVTVSRRLFLAGVSASALFTPAAPGFAMQELSALIDDLSRPHPEAALGTSWRFVADTVMGGVSSGAIERTGVGGRAALRLSGAVSLENNGGFIQMALNFAPDGGSVDASRFTGVEITVQGNGEVYGLHLRTDDLDRPWQSYRSAFEAGSSWQTVRLPFREFGAHRTEAPLDLRKLRRIGLVAIGNAFEADLALSDIRFN